VLTLGELLLTVVCSLVWINCAWKLSQALGNGKVNLNAGRGAGTRMTAARATMPIAFWSHVALLAAALIVLGFMALAALYLAYMH
jgi:hypothetical protein